MVSYQRGGRTKTGEDLTFTNTKISVGSSSTAILSENLDRKYMALVNDSDEPIYIGIGEAAVLNEGIRLNNGGGTYELVGPDLHSNAINGISTSGSKNITVAEGE